MRLFNKLLFLTFALIVGGATSACGLITVDNADRASNNTTTVQNKSMLNDKTGESKGITETKTDKLAEVYDGTTSIPDRVSPSSNFHRVLENEIRAKESVIKNKGNYKCTLDFSLTDYAKGSFTAPKSEQTVYLYKFCDNESSGAIVNGIAVVEGEKPVANYIYEGMDSYSLVNALPDINQNGLSEIVLLETGSESYSPSTISLYELKHGKIALLGDTESYSVVFKNGQPAIAYTYKMMAQPSASPAYFRETYQREPDGEKWKLSKKSEKFSLREKGDVSGFIEIN